MPSTPTPPIAPTPAAEGRPVPEDVRRTAEEFEAVFLARMLQTVGKPLRGPGAAASGSDDPWGSMLIDAYARMISRAGGIGIADTVVREMLRLQEGR